MIRGRKGVDQSVEVISPLNSGKQEVIGKILLRRRWIIKQQRYFRDLQSHEQHNLTITGAELHYLGRQYRLRIITCDQTTKAALHGRYLDVPVESSDDQGMVKRRISDWYRERTPFKRPVPMKEKVDMSRFEI